MSKFAVLVFLPVFLFAASLIVVPVDPAPAASRLEGHFEPIVADTDVNLYGVRVFSDGTVYLCGADGNFVRSEDTGKTWEAEQVAEGVSLRTMAWVDAHTGLLAGLATRTRTHENVLLQTHTGGLAFESLDVKVKLRVNGFAFLDSSRGWLVAGDTRTGEGTWLRTDDGGESWKSIDSIAYGIPGRALTSIAAADDCLWAVGTHVKVGLVGDAAKALLYRKKKGSVVHSDDGGRSWMVQDAGNPADSVLSDVDFFDKKHGFVAGTGGFLALTADGGETWKRLDTGTTEDLLSVDAVGTDTAFAVGKSGTAIGVKAGQVTRLRTGVTVHLRDCSFKDEYTGFAVGRDGTVLRFVRDW